MTWNTERFEKGGKSWSISYDDSQTTLVIVEDGVEHVERFEKPWHTYRRFGELLSAKTHAGWTRVVEPGPPVTHHARNEQLEVPLVEDPFDQKAWSVYGDWLQQRGDPRGEYIALRAAWHARPYDPFLGHRVWEWHRRHADYFGGLPARVELGMGGFLDKVELTQQTVETLTSPELRFVTEVIASSNIEGAVDRALMSMGPHFPATVRKLSVLSHSPVRFEPVQATLERLHELRVVNVPSEDGFHFLSTRPWGHLRSLSIEKAEGPLGRPTSLLACELPSLTALSFTHLPMDAGLMRVIAGAPYAGRLQTLCVMPLDDGAAKVLLELIGRFPALTELIVDGARISPQIRYELWSALKSRGGLKFNLMPDPD